MTTPAIDPVKALRDDLDAVILGAMRAHPRNHQIAAGPSDLGNPCDACLARKLSGTATGDESEHAWKARVGTFIHAGLETDFDAANAAQGTDPDAWRWLTERRIYVGDVNGIRVEGSCDLYDRHTKSIVDWKSAGKYVLSEVGPKAHTPGGRKVGNRTQAHLYGRGYTLLGLPVERVALYYLPRDGKFPEGRFWSEPYDETVALDALARATTLHQGVTAAQEAGLLDEYLDSLDTSPRCYRCGRTDKAERLDAAEGLPSGGETLASLIATPADRTTYHALAGQHLAALRDRPAVEQYRRDHVGDHYWDDQLDAAARQRWSALPAKTP